MSEKRMLDWNIAQSQDYFKDKENFIVSIGIFEAKEGTRNMWSIAKLKICKIAT
jgi:hypothetical protein